MKLGTHNSMSYLKPRKWYLAPFRFIAKCQSSTIEEQYNKGARMFDLRITFNKEGNPEFRHGAMAFKGNVYTILETLNKYKRPVYIRLILEDSSVIKENEIRFRDFCMNAEEHYKYLRFFAGNRRCDWKVIYKFKAKDPEIVQAVSSMSGSKINGVWPWLYAKLNNDKTIKEYADKNTWVLMDFV